jgi:hypothetical protein
MAGATMAIRMDLLQPREPVPRLELVKLRGELRGRDIALVMLVWIPRSVGSDLLMPIAHPR